MTYLPFTPSEVMALEEHQVFVFGSNWAGRHGMGAAKTARTEFGAETGVGFGPTGKCFAIPTKSKNLAALELQDINVLVQIFLAYAAKHPEKEFLVTKIGCGLAGYHPKEIAPMFLCKTDNVVIPREFIDEQRILTATVSRFMKLNNKVHAKFMNWLELYPK